MKKFRVMALEQVGGWDVGEVRIVTEDYLYYRADHSRHFKRDGEEFYLDGWYNNYFAIEPVL